MEPVKSEPVITLHVDPNGPAPLTEEQKVAFEEVLSRLAAEPVPERVPLLVHGQWLSPCVATLVKSAAIVSAYFARLVDDPCADHQEREMFRDLAVSLTPFQRKSSN